MKSKNQVIHSDDEDYLKRLEEDFLFMGRNAKLVEGKLIIFALPRKRKKKVRQS